MAPIFEKFPKSLAIPLTMGEDKRGIFSHCLSPLIRGLGDLGAVLCIEGV